MDDREFETYLRGFEPRMPAALPVLGPEKKRRWFGVMLAAAAVLALGVFVVRDRGPVAGLEAAEPLTIGGLNRLVAAAPAGIGPLDDVRFAFQVARAEVRGRSALDVLSEEDFLR